MQCVESQAQAAVGLKGFGRCTLFSMPFEIARVPGASKCIVAFVSPLRTLYAPCVVSSARVRATGGAGKQCMRPTLTCPYCAAQVTEDERHVLWHYACRTAERGAWLPWLQEATGNLPALSTVVDDGPACLQHACLIPSWATEGVEPEQVDEFVYRLFGLALSVLTARMRAEQAASDRGHVGLLFPDVPRPGRGRTYLWQELVRCRGRAAGHNCGWHQVYPAHRSGTSNWPHTLSPGLRGGAVCRARNGF